MSELWGRRKESRGEERWGQECRGEGIRGSRGRRGKGKEGRRGKKGRRGGEQYVTRKITIQSSVPYQWTLKNSIQTCTL